MKYAYATAALFTIVSAQSLSDIPACAIPCIDNARKSATSCSDTDYKCLCANINSLTGAATTCVLADCGAETAANEVLPGVQKFCEEVEAGGGSSSSKTSATSAAESSTTTAAPSSTTTAPTTPATTPATTRTPSQSSNTTTASITKPVSSTTESAPPSSTAATAGAAIVGSIGSFGMLVVGALAAF